jgi:cysteine-rich repeat protein
MVCYRRWILNCCLACTLTATFSLAAPGCGDETGESNADPDALSDTTSDITDTDTADAPASCEAAQDALALLTCPTGTTAAVVDTALGQRCEADRMLDSAGALIGLCAPAPVEGCALGCRVNAGVCGCGVESVTTTAVTCEQCVTLTCGDGQLDAGEGCDNGPNNSNTIPGACRTNCQPASCGDGTTDPGEGCDDANSNNSDACDNLCRPTTCGDGILQTGEACDNGPANSDSTPDACRTICQPARCGDGVPDTGETCDDSNFANTDGCDNTCNTEPGYACQGQPSLCDTVCGDSIVIANETCDDGNAASGDGCDDVCAVEEGYNCNNQPPRSICAAVCGDGLVRGGEVCDDGNTNGLPVACLVDRCTYPASVDRSGYPPGFLPLPTPERPECNPRPVLPLPSDFPLNNPLCTFYEDELTGAVCLRPRDCMRLLLVRLLN